MKNTNIFAFVRSVAAVLLLAGCGGALNATIGGTINGLSGKTSITLLNNGTDQITVSASAPDNTFIFDQTIEAGNTYNVTVLQQPLGETCTIPNGTGTVEQSIGNVTSIVVNCSATITASNDVLGTVSGLASGQTVTLLDNGTDSVTVTGTSASMVSFIFPTPLAVGTAYQVVVSSTSGPTCTIVNNTGNGTIEQTGAPTPVTVTCN